MFNMPSPLGMPTDEKECSTPQIMEKKKLLLLAKLPMVPLFSLLQVVKVLLHKYGIDM